MQVCFIFLYENPFESGHLQLSDGGTTYIDFMLARTEAASVLSHSHFV